MRARRRAKEAFGTVHIVVNNAGGPMRRMDRQILWPDSDWIGDLDNKILGALRVTRAFLPLMPSDGTGPHHQHQRNRLDDRLGAGADARLEQRGDEPGNRLSRHRSGQPADHRQHRGAGPRRHRGRESLGREHGQAAERHAKRNSSPASASGWASSPAAGRRWTKWRTRWCSSRPIVRAITTARRSFWTVV